MELGGRMKATITKKHIECARVYIDRNNRTNLRLKCFFCCSVFTHWTRFAQHIETRHCDLERAYRRAKSLWDEATISEEHVKTPTVMGIQSGMESKLLSHEAMKEEVSTPESNMDLVTGLTDVLDHVTAEFAAVENVTENITEFNVELLSPNCPPIILSEDIGQDDSEEVLGSADNVDVEITESRITKRHFPDSVDSDDSGEIYGSISKRILISYDTHQSVAEAIQDGEDEEEESELQDMDYEEGLKPESESCNEATHSDKSEIVQVRRRRNPSTYQTRVFFQFRETNPEIVLYFIAMIKRNSCQWNPNDSDYYIKDKRDESSEQMCLELLERWNIATTPQVVRASVLSLIRWFQLEYLRQQEHKDDFKCHHPEYYSGLNAFLPHEGIRRIPCDQCHRTFKSEPLLRSHKYMEHDGEIPYSCRYCGRTFLHISSYRNHENRHSKRLVWQCDKCEYRSFCKSDYTLHKITHSDIRGYVCDLCGAAYKSSSSLNVHKRTHGPPRLKCPKCGRKFHENYRLKRHMQQHIITKGAEVKRPFLCIICNMGFTRNANLQKHLIRHRLEGEIAADGSDNELVTLREEEDFDFLETISEESQFQENNVNGSCYSPMSSEDEHEPEIESDNSRPHMKVYSCIKCGKQFMELQALQTHSLKEHRVPVKIILK